MKRFAQIFLSVVMTLIVFSTLFAENLKVGKIDVIGNERTKDYIILRELTIKTGEPVDDDKITEDTNRLLNLGIFSEVYIEYTAGNDGTDVQVIVIERLAIIPFPSMRYTEMEGWAYGGGIYHRNFSGRNRTLGAYALFGGSTDLYIMLTDPWIAGERISLTVEGSHIVRDHPYEDFYQTEHSLWAEAGKRWGYNWWGRIKAGYRRIESDITGITLSMDREDRTPFVKFTGIYNTLDIWANPTRGVNAGIKVSQNGIPNGKPDFREFTASGSIFFPVPYGRTMGIMTGIAVRNGSMPPYERYYFGGAYSVRGMAPNSSRGNRLLLSGVEYRVDILRKRQILPKLDLGLGGTLFWDGGMVWTGSFKQETRFMSGFGVGVRFLVPMVEVFRVDMGWTMESSYRISASVGAKI